MEPHVAGATLEDVREPVRLELDQVFDELRRIVEADLPLISDVNEHLMQVRGKMFRPTLALLAAKTVGTISPREVTLGAIIELIHLATLIHDDSVDHSALRRGQPTVNALFTHEIAVIMGDYLYSRAIEELVKLDSLELLRIISRVTNELTVGEIREVVAHDALSFSEADYDELIKAKTASLMTGACEVGALTGDPEFRAGLKEYGTYLGLAFQVTDDLLDYTETQMVLGKPTGQDLREHKMTLPLIAALPKMTSSERAQVESLMANPTPSDDLISSVRETVDLRGGISAARARAVTLARQAEARLDGLPPGPGLDALRACITYAIDRRN